MKGIKISTLPKLASRSVAVILGFGIAAAQAAPMSLSDYVADAISANPLVLEQVHIFRQAQQDQAIARSGWRPSVDLLATAGRYEGESPTVVGSQGQQKTDYDSAQAELSITQNIFNGFDTRNGTKQADAGAVAALFNLYDTADNVALDAVQAYIEVLKQHRLLVLAQENLRSHEETLVKITKRSQSGAGRRSQLEQTEGRVAQARAGLLAQRNNLEDALTEAHQLLGRYVVPEEFSEPAMPERLSENLDALTDAALIQHPALKVAKSNIEESIFDQKRSNSKYYPKLDLTLAQEVGQDLNGIPGDTEESSVVLTLTYNFYNGGADRAEKYQKISKVHEHQQYFGRVRRQIINALRLAWMGDKYLHDQLKYLQQHVIQSQKTMVSYQEEFFIGQRDLIDLLDAKNELIAAQNSYATAYFDALTARYRILEGSGRLFQGLGLNPVIEDDNLVVAKVHAKGKDKMPLDWDRDQDEELDRQDHCDNTLSLVRVDQRGCEIKAPIAAPEPAVASAIDVGLKAVDDRLILDEGGVVEISHASLLGNDVAGKDRTLLFKAYTQPRVGSLAYNSDDNLIYRAAEGFEGIDTFTYVASDGEVTDTATVTISVRSGQAIDFTKAYYVNYLFDQSVLTPESSGVVGRIITALKKQPTTKVTISTYTDSLGSDAYNFKLSLRRATATRSMLVNAGISASRIQIYAGGESNPLADNATKSGQAINRRGEFTFQTR
ncbi:Outer membrane efflux protein BepC [Zhongshania aliphaticivorans]|uniref:Outer membrane efflux protein BepC n=1 Tax=Zhongshania aliphaticivorans TaxID=1470434 RepID=A0A5S9PRX0_9GAMM|nr:TolC family outer membrane protein [Zhongshania aliphaticivorans]CAA0107205.1 Outer membrane efflux protein BepC [Zhongshania aliphaticivorans]CAA0107287.1 Outer membrane efflux protein BepC [Zhongshania aliphaticivorans]